MSFQAALLLAAGLGTRLRPLTDVLPKCLVPVCGRPLLLYWLEMLERAGVERIIVNLHHHADLVRQFIVESRFASRVVMSHEPRLLGTAGTILAHREVIERGPTLIAHADNLSVFDPGRFMLKHAGRPAPAVMTMMTFATSNPGSCGIVETDSRGVVTAFHEKVADPPGNLANGAVYAMDPEVLEFFPRDFGDFLDLSTDVIPRLMGRIYCSLNHVLHRDIGTPDSLTTAQLELALRCPEVIRHAAPVDPAWINLLHTGAPPLGKRAADAAAAMVWQLREHGPRVGTAPGGACS